jgi:hypothetical protein
LRAKALLVPFFSLGAGTHRHFLGQNYFFALFSEIAEQKKLTDEIKKARRQKKPPVTQRNF